MARYTSLSLIPSRNRVVNTGGNSTSQSMPSSSCSRSRWVAGPAPSAGEPSGRKYDAASKLMGLRPVMFWPFFIMGRPSMSQPSPPSGSGTSRGARSFHLAGTYSCQPSGGVSTWPSAEMTWYLRVMASAFRIEPQGVPCEDQLLLVIGDIGERSGDGVKAMGPVCPRVREVARPQHLRDADLMAVVDAVGVGDERGGDVVGEVLARHALDVRPAGGGGALESVVHLLPH